MQYKATQGVRVSSAVVTMNDAPEGEVTEETLDVEEECQEEFNTWFWSRQKIMEVNNKAMKNEAIKKKETNDDDLDSNKDDHIIKDKTKSTIDLGSQRDSDWSSTVKFKMSENSDVKNAVVTSQDAAENVLETLEDKRCRVEFNA